MSLPPVFPLSPNRSLPERLRAGDQHAWTVEPNLPEGTWLFYVLTGVIQRTPVRQILFQPTATTANGQTTYSGGVQVSGSQASFALPSATTATWQPGRYQWVLFAQDAAGDRWQVSLGEIRIEPNPLGAVPADPRSFNERMLAQIRAVLQGNALDDVQMYKIGTRELTKVDRMVLMKQEAIFEARVRNEYRRKGMFVPTKDRGITFGARY